MPKRKRPSPSPSPDAAQQSSSRNASRNISHQRKLCTRILESKTKALTSALRLGATFERQKYSRRRKTALSAKDEKAVARLEEEYKILKALDIPKLAEQHLRKTVGKVKSLSTAEGVPAEWKEVEKGEKKEAAVLNVQARLFKVGAVKEVVDGCVLELKGVVGVAGVGKAAEKKEVKEETRKKAKVEEDEEEDSSDDGGAFASFDARIAAPSSAEEDSDDSLSDDRRPPSLENSDAEDFDIDALESEEEEEEEEATFTNSEDQDDSDMAIPRDGYIITDEDESSDFEEPSAFEGFSDDDADEKPTHKAKAKAAAAPAKVSMSTFLPSLSHAAYFSGSESEPEDLDIDIAPKKNRRGQRARQKIWEAKFGEKAKHKQKDERNKGWDPKRGAVSDDRGGKGARARGGRGPQVSGENMTELGPRKAAPPKRDDTGSLHPSWQAAKAAKEKKMAAKPQGTKIVFD